MSSNISTDFKTKFREICTYHGEGGTSGYNLSEEQFEKLFTLIADTLLKIVGEDEENKAEHPESFKSPSYFWSVKARNKLRSEIKASFFKELGIKEKI